MLTKGRWSFPPLQKAGPRVGSEKIPKIKHFSSWYSNFDGLFLFLFFLIYRAKFPLSCLPRLYAIPYGRSHIRWNVHWITPWRGFAMFEHMRTCSFPNLKNHYKTQHMMASIFAVWESGKTGEARTARKIRARQHLTSCHYSRYDGFKLCENMSTSFNLSGQIPALSGGQSLRHPIRWKP